MTGQPYYHFIPSRFPPHHFDALAVAAKAQYGRFDAEVPGVLAALFGRNRSPHAGYFTHLRLAAFDSFAAHAAYQATALHDEIVRTQRSLVEDMVAADIAAPRQLGPAARAFTVVLLKPVDSAPDAAGWARAEGRAAALRDTTPGLAFLELGANLSSYAKGWTRLLVAAFATAAACHAFEVSAARTELMDELAPRFGMETATIGPA